MPGLRDAFVSNVGIAQVGQWWIATDIRYGLARAMVRGEAPPPEHLLLLAGDYRCIWKANGELLEWEGGADAVDYLCGNEHTEEERVPRDDMLDYLLRVGPSRIYWQEQQERDSRRIRRETEFNCQEQTYKLSAQYQWLRQWQREEDDVFRRYLQRLKEVVDAYTQDRIVGPALADRNAAQFHPFDEINPVNQEPFKTPFPYSTTLLDLLLEE